MNHRSPARSTPASTAAFARYLLQAMGLGAAAATALGSAACGGKVVVDTAGGGGDGGGTTSTSTTTITDTVTTTMTTTVTTTSACDQVPTKYSPITECVPATANGCLAKDDPVVFGSIFMQLQANGCGGGDLVSVLCGPYMTVDGNCCYVVDGIEYQCGGRPFVVDGAPRVAGIEARSDWMARADACVADLVDVDPTTRASLAEAWTRSALDEHASVASFARFVLELLATGAPADLVVAAQQAMREEIRHAELCFGLASAYAGHALGPGPLAIDGGVRTNLADIVAAAVREGCVGETLAAFTAAAARDAASEPSVRDALDVIARDEAEHAALAFRFVAWVIRRGDAQARAAVKDAFAAALATPPASLPHLPGDAAALRAHGQLPLAERRNLVARCLAEVVAPCARALFADTVTPVESSVSA